jgi:hypothetical protein
MGAFCAIPGNQASAWRRTPVARWWRIDWLIGLVAGRKHRPHSVDLCNDEIEERAYARHIPEVGMRQQIYLRIESR